MFTIATRPSCLIFRSRLLLTTALISVAGLSFAPDQAQAQMYLSNVDPGNGPVRTTDGIWQSNDAIWTEPDGGNPSTLPTTATGVLTAATPGTEIGLDISNSGVTVGGLRVDSGLYSLFGGDLSNGLDVLTFSVAAGATLDVRSDIDAAGGTISIASAPGRLFFSGQTDADLIDNGGILRVIGTANADLTNQVSAQLGLSGTLDGDLSNDGLTQISGTLNGAVTNRGRFQTSGNATITGRVTNAANPADVPRSQITVADGHTLTIDDRDPNLMALTNAGDVMIAGRLVSDVSNLTGGQITLQDGVLDGALINSGSIEGSGSISGALTNNGDARLSGTLGSVTNDGQLSTLGSIGAPSELAVSSLTNNGALTISGNDTLSSSSTVSSHSGGSVNLYGTLNAGLFNTSGSTLYMLGSTATIQRNLNNLGSANIRGSIGGTLDNQGVVRTSGDVTVGQLVTGIAGATTVRAGETLTSTNTAQNSGSLTINGTLGGDVNNTADPDDDTIFGTIALNAGGVITGDVTNAGRLDAGGTIQGDVTSSGTLNVVGATEMGRLTTTGSVVVENNETLTTHGNVDNRGSFSLSGALNINDGNSTLTNRSGGNLTLSGAAITGDVVNWGGMAVNSSSTIAGSLDNRTALTLNSASGSNVTLSVSDVFRNSGTVDGSGTGVLRIAAGEIVNAGGTVTNVRVDGNIRNEATLNYTEDEVLDGNLTNAGTGDFFVSAALDMDGNDLLNQGDVVIRTDPDSSGNLNNVNLITNEGNFDINGGTSVSAAQVVNRNGGTLDVNGTLNSATALQNSATLSVGATGTVNGGLTNSGNTTLAGGTVNGTLTNASGGRLTGNGTLGGALVNNGLATIGGSVAGAVSNGGTLTSSGTLVVGALVNNEVLNVADGSTLQSGTAVQNNDRATITGRLDAALNNAGTTTLAGGTVTGMLTNAGGATLSGNGTLGSGLVNRGSATIAGSVAGAVANAGTLTSSGTLVVGSLVNNEVLDVVDGSTLRSGTVVQNNDRATITGRLDAALNNTGNTTLSGGTVTGALTNASGATLSGNGTLSGGLVNNGQATIGGSVAGALTNGGTLTSSGTLVLGSLTNNEVLNVADGSILRSGAAVQNNDRATISGTLAAALNNAGTTALSGGTVTGELTNSGTLTGTGRINGALANSGQATIGGEVTTVTNSGTLVSAGTLNVGTLTNNEIVRVATGSEMNVSGRLTNTDRLVVGGQLNGTLANSGSTQLNGGTITGTVANTGTFGGSGSVQGHLTNGGTLRVGASGNMTVQRLTNNELVEIAQGGTLQTANEVENNERIVIAGTLAGDLLNNPTGEAELAGGTVQGDLRNVGTLTGNGTIDGALRNRGTATIGGQVTDLVNLTGGVLNVSGELTADTFSNAGEATIAASNRLTVLDVALNQTGAAEVTLDAADNLQGGRLTVDGTLDGVLRNAGTLLGTGVITGTVVNSGTTRWGGRIGGDLDNAGQANLAGQVAGNVDNRDGATLVAGNLSVAGLTTNETGGTMRVATDATMRASGGVLNESGAALNLLGTLGGNVVNHGAMTQTGVLNGVLTTDGSADLGGTINGGLIYQGGTLATRNDFSVVGDFVLQTGYAIGTGRSIEATRTIVDPNVTLGLQGQIDGALVNNGTVNVVGNQARVTGQLTNNNVVDLSSRGGNDVAGDVLTVGGLAGAGEYRLDIDTEAMTADRIVIDGGAATGAYALVLDFRDDSFVPSLGNRVTLIDADEAYREQNTFTVSHTDLPSISERIVYSVDQFGDGGDVALVSQTNPAIGALFGNVALTQSLIGSVINRPTSPFVTALVYDDAQKPCGIGSWGRVIGGHAKATGSTNNGVSTAESEISADYYGVQVGTDLACFDDRFGGWDMAFGVLGGINRGDTNQPVYAIDPNNSQNLTGTLTSYTSTDFEQRYAGVYATASKGALQADLQYRIERTDFTIENKPIGGNRGLGLNKTDFSSDAHTLSGSLSYGFPVGKNGWAVVPTVGFAWSKMSTDSLSFTDRYRVTFEDSTRKIGFVGATVAKTFVQQADNSVLYAFATGTWYKDFADPTISVFDHETDASFVAQELESDNLGAYGEISVGANWIKVLGPKARGRQLSAGARVDARFGDDLDSVGVSGQLRWQF